MKILAKILLSSLIVLILPSCNTINCRTQIRANYAAYDCEQLFHRYTIAKHEYDELKRQRETKYLQEQELYRLQKVIDVTKLLYQNNTNTNYRPEPTNYPSIDENNKRFEVEEIQKLAIDKHCQNMQF